jgi:hypothetical protein
MALLKEDCSLDIDRINQLPLEKKHNLNEEYLNSLTEEQRIDEMSEWSAEEWGNYYCPEGTISLEEYRELGHKLIREEYERLGWL